MTLQQLFHHLDQRKMWLFAIAAGLIIASTPWILQNQKEKFKTYVFFTVAAQDQIFTEEKQPALNSFYLISASDIFAESIIGWFKNPGFIAEVQTASGMPLPTFNTRKETKLNVMIFFSTDLQKNNEKISAALVTTLEKYIADYNLKTNTHFASANQSIQTVAVPPNLLLDIAISILSSLLISTMVILLPLSLGLKK